MTVTAYVLNVGTGQGTDAEILTQIEKGEEYEMTGEPVDGWYPVKVGDIDGWVSGELCDCRDFLFLWGDKRRGRRADREKRKSARRWRQAGTRCRPVGEFGGSPGRLLLIMPVSLSGIPMYGAGQALRRARIVPVLFSRCMHILVSAFPRTTYDMVTCRIRCKL